MSAKRRLIITTTAVITLTAITGPMTADAAITTIRPARHVMVAPSESARSGLEAAMAQASSPRPGGKTNSKPGIGPAVAAAVVARAAAPAVGRFAAKWAQRGALAAGGSAAVSAGAEAGKDVYNAAKSFGKKLIGIWN